MEDKEFVKKFEKKAESTIKKFKLITAKDKILVAVSGGKDSTAVLHLLNKLFKNVEAITINAYIGSYSRKNLENIRGFCEKNSIRLHEVSFRKEFGRSLCYIRDMLRAKKVNLKSCAICGILKRYLLNKKALEIKATKLVTGHNLDDEAQSFMINLVRSNLDASARLGPMSGAVKDKRFVPRIKPLYLTAEKDVERYSRIMDFPVVYERCPCSTDAYRRFIGGLLNDLEEKNPEIKMNIVKYFLKAMSHKKPEYQKISYCTHCHQPAKREICRTCEILGLWNTLKK